MSLMMRAYVLVVWVAVLLLQVLLVSQSVDAYGLILHGNATGWLAWFGYLGAAAKWAVLCAVILLVLLGPRLLGYWRGLCLAVNIRRLGAYLVVELVCFVLFLHFSQAIFADPTAAHQLGFLPFVLWLLSGFFTLFFWLLAMVPAPQLGRWLKREGGLLAVSMGVATVVLLLTRVSATLWSVLADQTFNVAGFWLQLVSHEAVFSDPEDKILGLRDFYVRVADACSGYEGIGLVLAFTAVYLWAYRRDFRFPAALWLFPVGALLIWLLNTLRIAVLVLIGAYGSPEVAVGGFHSQAGWITFIATSVLMLWLAGKSTFLAQTANHPNKVKNPSEEFISEETGEDRHSAARMPIAEDRHLKAGMNQAIAVLLPMVALLAVMLLTSAFSHGWDSFYPLRVVAVLAALAWGWSLLVGPALNASLGNKKLWLESFLIGIAVAIVWVLLLGATPEADASFTEGLAQLSPWWTVVWLLFRFVGAVVTVPIAEELAFRGYLLCQLSRSEAYITGKLPFVWLAAVISAVAFGALHGAWIAGVVAGGAYVLVRLRHPTIIAPIIAHATTNGLLAIYAAITGCWGVM